MSKKLAALLIAMVPLVFACSSESEGEDEIEFDYAPLWDDVVSDICADSPHLQDSVACNP